MRQETWLELPPRTMPRASARQRPISRGLPRWERRRRSSQMSACSNTRITLCRPEKTFTQQRAHRVLKLWWTHGSPRAATTMRPATSALASVGTERRCCRRVRSDLVAAWRVARVAVPLATAPGKCGRANTILARATSLHQVETDDDGLLGITKCSHNLTQERTRWFRYLTCCANLQHRSLKPLRAILDNRAIRLNGVSRTRPTEKRCRTGLDAAPDSFNASTTNRILETPGVYPLPVATTRQCCSSEGDHQRRDHHGGQRSRPDTETLSGRAWSDVGRSIACEVCPATHGGPVGQPAVDFDHSCVI